MFTRRLYMQHAAFNEPKTIFCISHKSALGYIVYTSLSNENNREQTGVKMG